MTATAPFRWCTLYVDTPDPAVITAEVARLLGPGSELDVFSPPGFTVEVRRNPDHTGGPDVLDWPTVIEIDALAQVPDTEVVAFVTRLIDHLHAAAQRVAAESDFIDHLPPPDHR